jgi:ribonuclease BN (tRNA processing enzyme)
LRTGQTTIWLEAGSGTFASLQRVIDPSAVDAIVLSHLHPDHWSDLEGFAVWALLNAHKPVDVYAPAGLRAHSYFGDRDVLAWHDLSPSDQVVIGDLRARFAATDHGPPTLAVRFDAADADGDHPDQALAFSADTGADWSPEELGTGIGTLLCEASYTKREEAPFYKHLSARQAGRMAGEAGVRRLILTHRWPTVSAEDVAEEAQAAFGGPVEQATMGAVFNW